MSTNLIIYLTGLIPAYFSLRSYIKYASGEWTRGDRITALVLMFFSWVLVLASIMCVALIKVLDNDEPAKW